MGALSPPDHWRRPPATGRIPRAGNARRHRRRPGRSRHTTSSAILHEVEQGGVVVKIDARLNTTAVESRQHREAGLRLVLRSLKGVADRVLDNLTYGAAGSSRSLFELRKQMVV